MAHMERYLKLSSALVALAISALALSSCNGGGDSGYAPPPQMPVGGESAPQPQDVQNVSPAQTGPAESAPAEMPPADTPPAEMSPEGMPPAQAARETPHEFIPQSVVTPPPQVCPTDVLPGTYTTIIAQGHVSGTTFTAKIGAAASFWERMHYVVATPSPKPTPTPKRTPTPKPSPTPTPQPLFFYLGSYVVKHGAVVDTVGCAALIATQNGASIKGTAFNGENVDNPEFTKPFHSTFVAFGTVTKLTITGLSATGGHGTFSLSNGTSGTITLTRRLHFP